MSISLLRIGNCRRFVNSVLQSKIYTNACWSYHSLGHHNPHHHPRSDANTAVCVTDLWHRQENVGCVRLQCRRHLHLPNPFKRRQNYRLIDKVPTSHDIVYSSTYSAYISYLYPSSMLGMFGSTLAALNLYVYQVDISKGNFEFFDDWMEIMIAMPVMGLLTYVSWLVATRAPLRIYFNENDSTFVAVFASMMPWRVKQLQFRAGEVRRLYPHPIGPVEIEDREAHGGGMLGTFRGRYALGSRRLSIVPQCFRYPYFYNTMIGCELDKQRDEDEHRQH